MTLAVEDANGMMHRMRGALLSISAMMASDGSADGSATQPLCKGVDNRAHVWTLSLDGRATH
jgi:hypothetical protein